jgi:hypothetical protein
MIVYHGGATFPVSGSDTRPASPGTREAQLGIAFNVCVSPVAPAFSPLNPSSCDVNVLMSAVESDSSGASVTSLTEDWRLEDPKTVDGEVEAG